VSALASPRLADPERVLVVEDEPDLRNLVAHALREAGFAVLSADTGREALAVARAEKPAVVVLDLMLPDMLGTAVCGALRHDPEVSDVGILLLTARSSENDRVYGLEAGADDYVAKPFNVREVILRIRMLARRTREARLAREKLARPPSARWRGLEIELDRQRVTLDGAALSLRPLEFKLLATFLTSPGKLFTRADLLHVVWGIDEPSETRTVDTHVRRLRERLGTYSAAIQTAHGVGYRLRDEDAPDE
jgi:two-component system phosphate regulon response regulator PhoB